MDHNSNGKAGHKVSVNNALSAASLHGGRRGATRASQEGSSCLGRRISVDS